MQHSGIGRLERVRPENRREFFLGQDRHPRIRPVGDRQGAGYPVSDSRGGFLRCGVYNIAAPDAGGDIAEIHAFKRGFKFLHRQSILSTDIDAPEQGVIPVGSTETVWFSPFGFVT